MLRLIQFRQYYRLTQRDVAEKIGIDQRQWSRYEREENELPIRYLRVICEQFNVSADWLLGLTEEISRNENA